MSSRAKASLTRACNSPADASSSISREKVPKAGKLDSERDDVDQDTARKLKKAQLRSAPHALECGRHTS